MEESFAAGFTLSAEEGEEREVVFAGFNCDLKLIVGVACGFDGSALGEGVVLDRLALFFNISAIIGFTLVGIGTEMALPDDTEEPPEDDPQEEEEEEEDGAETSAAERSFFSDSGTFFNFPPFLISANRSTLPLGMAAGGGGGPDAGGGGGGGPGGGGGGGADMCLFVFC
jgi:uncharacterized membrane protein YgcG